MTKERAYELREILSRAMQSADDATAAENPLMYPEWEPDAMCTEGMKVRYNDRLYKILKSHVSEVFHNPEDAPDLFAELPGDAGTADGQEI